MNDEWLYQVRIRVNSDVSNNLRTNKPKETAEQIVAIAKRPVSYTHLTLPTKA